MFGVINAVKLRVKRRQDNEKGNRYYMGNLGFLDAHSWLAPNNGTARDYIDCMGNDGIVSTFYSISCLVL